MSDFSVHNAYYYTSVFYQQEQLKADC